MPAIINTAIEGADRARRALRAVGGFDVIDVSPRAVTESVHAAIASGAIRVLVAGGDGSIGSAAAALAGTTAELAILPCGTLNHLARDLGLPMDLEQAAHIAQEGTAVRIDAATVNDRIFLNTSSVGAYVTFVRIRERLEPRLGYHAASLIAALRLLYRLPVFRVALEVNGTSREYHTPLVFVGVGERELKLPSLGGRPKHAGRGLHVMIIRRRSGARAVALALAAAARGVHAVAPSPAMDAFLVDHVRIHPRTHVAAVDGELISLTPPLDYRYLPGYLRVVLGGRASERLTGDDAATHGSA